MIKRIVNTTIFLTFLFTTTFTSADEGQSAESKYQHALANVSALPFKTTLADLNKADSLSPSPEIAGKIRLLKGRILITSNKPQNGVELLQKLAVEYPATAEGAIDNLIEFGYLNEALSVSDAALKQGKTVPLLMQNAEIRLRLSPDSGYVHEETALILAEVLDLEPGKSSLYRVHLLISTFFKGQDYGDLLGNILEQRVKNGKTVDGLASISSQAMKLTDTEDEEIQAIKQYLEVPFCSKEDKLIFINKLAELSPGDAIEIIVKNLKSEKKEFLHVLPVAAENLSENEPEAAEKAIDTYLENAGDKLTAARVYATIRATEKADKLFAGINSDPDNLFLYELALHAFKNKDNRSDYLKPFSQKLNPDQTAFLAQFFLDREDIETAAELLAENPEKAESFADFHSARFLALKECQTTEALTSAMNWVNACKNPLKLRVAMAEIIPWILTNNLSLPESQTTNQRTVLKSQLLYIQDKKAEAEKLIDNALASNPSSPILLEHTVYLKRELDKAAEAIQLQKKLLSIDTENSIPHCITLTALAIRANNQDLLRETVDTWLKHDPKSNAAQEMKISILASGKTSVEAYVDFLKNENLSSSAVSTLSKFILRQGEYEQNEVIIENVLDVLPPISAAELLFKRGRIHTLQDIRPDAVIRMDYRSNSLIAGLRNAMINKNSSAAHQTACKLIRHASLKTRENRNLIPSLLSHIASTLTIEKQRDMRAAVIRPGEFSAEEFEYADNSSSFEERSPEDLIPSLSEELKENPEAALKLAGKAFALHQKHRGLRTVYASALSENNFQKSSDRYFRSLFSDCNTDSDLSGVPGFNSRTDLDTLLMLEIGMVFNLSNSRQVDIQAGADSVSTRALAAANLQKGTVITPTENMPSRLQTLKVIGGGLLANVCNLEPIQSPETLSQVISNAMQWKYMKDPVNEEFFLETVQRLTEEIPSSIIYFSDIKSSQHPELFDRLLNIFITSENSWTKALSIFYHKEPEQVKKILTAFCKNLNPEDEPNFLVFIKMASEKNYDELIPILNKKVEVLAGFESVHHFIQSPFLEKTANGLVTVNPVTNWFFLYFISGDKIGFSIDRKSLEEAIREKGSLHLQLALELQVGGKSVDDLTEKLLQVEDLSAAALLTTFRACVQEKEYLEAFGILQRLDEKINSAMMRDYCNSLMLLAAENLDTETISAHLQPIVHRLVFNRKTAHYRDRLEKLIEKGVPLTLPEETPEMTLKYQKKVRTARQRIDDRLRQISVKLAEGSKDEALEIAADIFRKQAEELFIKQQFSRSTLLSQMRGDVFEKQLQEKLLGKIQKAYTEDNLLSQFVLACAEKEYGNTEASIKLFRKVIGKKKHKVASCYLLSTLLQLENYEEIADCINTTENLFSGNTRHLTDVLRTHMQTMRNANSEETLPVLNSLFRELKKLNNQKIAVALYFVLLDTLEDNTRCKGEYIQGIFRERNIDNKKMAAEIQEFLKSRSSLYRKISDILISIPGKHQSTAFAKRLQLAEQENENTELLFTTALTLLPQLSTQASGSGAYTRIRGETENTIPLAALRI